MTKEWDDGAGVAQEVQNSRHGENIQLIGEASGEGFTLIELLVVIIIIGILAAIAIPVFLNQRKKGVDASIKSDLKNMATLQETYVVDNPSRQGVSTTDSGTTWNDASLSKTTGVPVVAPAAPTFKPSLNNTITVQVNATGYCIIGTNPGGSSAEKMIYDSTNGGLKGYLTTAQINGLLGNVCD